MADGDRIARGVKTRNPAGTATFVGVRALDPYFQYAILGRGLADGLVSRLGTSTFAQGPTSNTGIALIDNLGLSPYRLVLLTMSFGAAGKHVLWKTLIGEESMDPVTGAAVGVFNTVFNTVNSLLFISAATSPAWGKGEGPHWDGWPSVPLTTGVTLFTVGIGIELVSEFQRKAFKSKPENKGQAHTTGLFGLARHINYGAYTLWRTGYALAAGGWVWGSLTGLLFAWDFSTRAIPSLDSYCSKRYGAQWARYKQQTPYKLIPFVY